MANSGTANSPSVDEGLLSRLAELIERVVGFDFQVSEETGRISLAAEYVPGVLALLEQATASLGAIEERYGEESFDQEEGIDSLSEIGALISTELAARGIGDLAFVARGDLRASRQELESAHAQNDILNMASHCDSGLRRLRKALISVESAIYEFEGREAPLRRWYDLDLSLETRRLYTGLREKILGREPPADDQLAPRLREVGLHFMELRTREVYPLLRIDDRVQLRRLHKRIQSWLVEGKSDPVAGQRLWQDLTGFAELLTQVSHRQELREHDRRLVLRAHYVLSGKHKPAQTPPPELVAELPKLRGLDEELDALLAGPEPELDERWRAPLERLRTALTAASNAF